MAAKKSHNVMTFHTFDDRCQVKRLVQQNRHLKMTFYVVDDRCRWSRDATGKRKNAALPGLDTAASDAFGL